MRTPRCRLSRARASGAANLLRPRVTTKSGGPCPPLLFFGMGISLSRRRPDARRACRIAPGRGQLPASTACPGQVPLPNKRKLAFQSNQSVQLMLKSRERAACGSGLKYYVTLRDLPYKWLILLHKYPINLTFDRTSRFWNRGVREHVRDWKSANQRPISGLSERREIPPRARH